MTLLAHVPFEEPYVSSNSPEEHPLGGLSIVGFYQLLSLSFHIVTKTKVTISEKGEEIQQKTTQQPYFSFDKNSTS